MKTYKGLTIGNDFGPVYVEQDGHMRPLPLRLDVRNHSPTGFAWGYGGSGPAQLALAILCDCIGTARAEPLYQRFKFAVIAALLQRRPFILDEEAVLKWVEGQR